MEHIYWEKHPQISSWLHSCFVFCTPALAYIRDFVWIDSQKIQTAKSLINGPTKKSFASLRPLHLVVYKICITFISINLKAIKRCRLYLSCFIMLCFQVWIAFCVCPSSAMWPSRWHTCCPASRLNLRATVWTTVSLSTGSRSSKKGKPATVCAHVSHHLVDMLLTSESLNI